MTQIVIELIVIFALLLANGVLAMAEMSLVSARKARLKTLAKEGKKSAVVALELAQAPNQFLSTVQVGITLVGILAGAFGGGTLAHWLADQIRPIPVIGNYAQPVSFGVVVVVITYFSLVIGELAPKRLALAAPERIACSLAGTMRRLSRLALPLVKFLAWSTDMILRIFGAPREAGAQASNEEVRLLMQEGEASGVFHKAEPQMVQRVLGLDEMPVSEILTPRPKVAFINRDDSHEQMWRKIVACRHSHFPVYEGNRDHVVGIISVKAIYANLAAGVAVDVSNLMVDALFVPETQTVVQLLDTFKKSGKHFAVVADEFGSVVGIVTLVDVLRAIVGEVPSREGRAQPELRAREDGTWLSSGLIPLSTLANTFGNLNLPPDDDRTYQTLAGFIIHRLGHIPTEGDEVSAGEWRFEVVDMDGQRIDKVLIHRKAASGGESAAR